VIAYVDTSTFLRAFLPDERGHRAARALIEDPSPELVLVTGWFTRIETVASVTKRTRQLAVRQRDDIVDALEAELGGAGTVIEILPDADQFEQVRQLANRIARQRWVTGPDAIHIASALVIQAMLPDLLQADDDIQLRFVTNDKEQSVAASEEGLMPLDQFDS